MDNNSAGTNEIEKNDVLYKIIIKTKDITELSLESLSLNIIGHLGTAEKLKLDEKSTTTGKLFEKDSTDEFEIKALDVGPVKKIRIGHDYTDRGILIDTVVIQKDETSFKFILDKWLDDSKNQKFIEVETDNVAQTIKTTNEVAVSDTKTNSLKDTSKQSVTAPQPTIATNEKREKKKKTNNLNDANSSLNKNPKSTNLTSNSVNNKTSSRRSQNTKSDYQSDSFTRQARMEKRIKYKPNLNTELHEESTHIELRRIKETINKETSKILCPKRKEHIPFVFNDLTPYSDTRHVEYLLNSPLNNQPVGHYNRYTAMTIVEPWVAHRMEHTVGPLFAKSIRHSSLPRPHQYPKSKDRPKKDQIEGSTLAPSFPKVLIKKPKGMNGPFYYDDIEIIRKELVKNLKNKTRFEEDRNRTINDYYRMNLDQSADSEKTWDTFRAYLENTPGSKKALKEIMNKVKLTDSIA